MSLKEICETIIPIAKHIAKAKEGAMFIVAPKNKIRKNHELMFPQLIEGYSLREPGIEKVLAKLATLDGAVLISSNGEVLAYGAKVKKSKPLRGFGTRHAAARGITHHVPDAFAILVSEESNEVKIMKEGEISLVMDGEDLPKQVDQKILSFLIDKDTSLLTDSNISVAKFPKIKKV